MSKRFLAVSLLLGVLFFCGGSDSFAMGERGARGVHEKMAGRMARELSLTDAQKKAFMERIRTTEDENAGIIKQNRDLMKKIGLEMQKPSPDASAVKNCIKGIGQNRTQLEIKRMDNILYLFDQLTPEQKEKFRKLHKDRPGMGKKIDPNGERAFKDDNKPHLGPPEGFRSLTKGQMDALSKLSPEQIEAMKDLTPEEIRGLGKAR